MLQFRLIIICLIFVCLILSSGVVDADVESRLHRLPPNSGLQLAGGENANNESKVYIVQLATPSAAEFHVAKSNQAFGKPTLTTPTRRFDKTSADIEDHVSKLRSEQASVIAKTGDNIQQIYSYSYSMNGFAAKMSPAQANKLEHMPEVLHVWEDEVRPLSTSSSASFLDLFEAEVGLRGAPGLDGEGIIIGVIDSGIAPGHPALQDKREADRPQVCRSNWGRTSLLGKWLCRRFDKMEDVPLFEPPDDWNGICETGPQFTEQNCNNKMIGARFFVEGALASGPIDADEILSPRDVDGHGTHTATTAAGNKVNASIFGTFLNSVEGMAPKARIATYKACWLRPNTTGAGCNTSDLANAVDMAVADGVDIINYSVGNTMFTVTAPDDVALMAAAKAGVLTSVAAGNDGPNFQTIGSPSGNPAVITVGASTRDGQHSVEAIRIDAPTSIAGRYASREASFTPPLSEQDPIEGQLVLVDDDDDTLPDGGNGNMIDACQALTNDSDITGQIALIERGGCDFDVKIKNAEDAGAIAVIVFNISGDPIVMIGDRGDIDIPALMIGAGDGDLLLGEIDADQPIDVVLDKSFFLSIADTGNTMGNFSSRGPGPVQDILKPDVTAPGVNILAGGTPDAINTVAGEFFAFLTGTSMSTPHVTGIAALLKQAHPAWSPAAIKSALMTTARQDITLPDGSQALAFDFGSGHIVPNSANDPGLVFDITDDEYDAFACGVASPGVAQSRCDQLETAGMSFAAVDLNQPSISVSRLTNAKTVSRRVTNVSDTTETYTAEIELPPGIDVGVSPSSLTIGPGQSASFDVTLRFVGGPQDIYRFGSLTWVSNDHRVRSVIAAQPLSVDAPTEIFSFGGSGNLTFPVEFGYTGSYNPQVHGLRLPIVIDDDDNIGNPAFVDQDPDKTFTFGPSRGVTQHLINVPAGEAFLRFALFDELTDGEDDLDLYVYYCPNDFTCSKIGESGGPTSREEVDIFFPPAGTYAMFVHGFAPDNVTGGPGTIYTGRAWSFGLNEDLGNMTATGPAFVNAGTANDVVVDWVNLLSERRYLGGISHNTPEGLVSLTLINISN